MAIKVTLLAHTPNPEQTVAMAAKLCYSPSDIENIREGLTEEKTTSFLNMLSDLGHASPTEHAEAHLRLALSGVLERREERASFVAAHPLRLHDHRDAGRRLCAGKGKPH